MKRTHLHRVPGQEELLQIEVTPRVPEPEAVFQRRPQHTSYQDLAILENADPELAEARWQQLRAEARRQIDGGHWAGRAVEDGRSGPYQRALFLEVRAGLAAEWQPRGMQEQLLVDAIAQATVLKNAWQWKAMNYLDAPDPFPRLDELPAEPETPPQRYRRETEEELRQKLEAALPPRLTQREAADWALGLVERYDRLIQRSLRALRDLRRYGGPVIVQNAPGGQVNIGEKQVNVATLGESPGG